MGQKPAKVFSVKVEKMPFLNGYGALTRYGVKWMICGTSLFYCGISLFTVVFHFFTVVLHLKKFKKTTVLHRRK